MEKVYRVRPGESLPGIAGKLNLPFYLLCRLNGTEEAEEGDLLLLPEECGRPLTVRPFETWAELAARARCTVEGLQEINGSFLFPFMKIYLPRGKKREKND